LLNDLVASGIVIERVEEPEEVLDLGRKETILPQNRQRPSVLVVRSMKGT
jgi:hypothetical protein